VQLFQQPGRARHHRYDIHRHDLVEARIREGHLFGVHLEQGLDVLQPALRHAPARFLEHFARHVDSGDAHAAGIQRQRQARAYAHLEDPVAGLELERIEHRLAPGLQHGTEDRVVDACIAPVGRFDGVDLHGFGGFCQQSAFPARRLHPCFDRE
jgi:hypothetical protein